MLLFHSFFFSLVVLVYCKHCFSLLLACRSFRFSRIISSASQRLIHSPTPPSSSSPTLSSFLSVKTTSSSSSSSPRSRLLVISSICLLRSFFHNLFVSFRYSGKTLDQESRPALNSPAPIHNSAFSVEWFVYDQQYHDY